MPNLTSIVLQLGVGGAFCVIILFLVFNFLKAQGKKNNPINSKALELRLASLDKNIEKLIAVNEHGFERLEDKIGGLKEVQ